MTESHELMNICMAAEAAVVTCAVIVLLLMAESRELMISVWRLKPRYSAHRCSGCIAFMKCFFDAFFTESRINRLSENCCNNCLEGIRSHHKTRIPDSGK